MDLFPSSAPHWHLLLNHFPSIGTVIALGLYLGSFYLKSEDLRRASLVLFLIMALLAIPTYISGAAAKWAILGSADVSAARIAAHQDAATLAFTALGITGCLSWFALWQYRRFSRPSNLNLGAILVAALVTVGFMIQTGSMGGDINHPEIRIGEELVAVEGQVGLSAAIEAYIIGGAWPWPAMEAVHFMGMALLFGVVLLVTGRVLGLVKSVPFAAMHRLLPLGVLGFLMNVVTGMLFFIADSSRYVTMTNSFFPKIALIAIGGVAVLYFTIFDRPWALKAGEDGPVTAKVMAVATILIWSGVLVFGRLLPYLEGAGG